jgi:hypothetical protein
MAGWFDSSDDDRAHELWAATFGLYSARHLAFPADPEGDPVPSTHSWWRSPVAEVPVSLRTFGERKAGGRTGARVDYSAAKRARLAERDQQQRRRTDAVRELASLAGPLRNARLSDDARAALLDLYSEALGRHGRPLTNEPVDAETRLVDLILRLELSAEPRASVTVRSPSGVLTMRGLSVSLDSTDLAEAEEPPTEGAGA